MKKLFGLLLLLVSINSFSQVLNEKKVIQQEHIDFSKESIKFVLHGTVEIDGHEFLNDTVKNKIIYWADLDGVKITDTANKVYVHRKCETVGCKIIHLEVPRPIFSPSWDGYKISTGNLLMYK